MKELTLPQKEKASGLLRWREPEMGEAGKGTALAQVS